MSTKSLLASSILLLGASLSFSSSAWADGHDAQWQVIPVADQVTVTNNDGSSQVVEPSCAFDTIAGPGGVQVDNSFHFYFKEGKKNKTVVFFNGGGACWDDATCVASLVQGDRPTYNPTVHAANSPVGAGGILDTTNEANPFHDWSMVFIPYCTGDVHVGSNDVTYFDVDGSLTTYAGAPIPVKHHGFDNFLAVREWMKGQFPAANTSTNKQLKRMLVAGSSAGGYGATLNFPHLVGAFPAAQSTLLSDGSAAVTSQGFLDSVFAPGGNWNLDSTLDVSTFAGLLGSFTVPTFNATLFARIATALPETRLAHYTTAYDLVQVQFLKIMMLLDQGVYSPTDWALTAAPADQYFFGLWNYLMEASLEALASTYANYQYYIGAGTIHTVLTDAFATAAMPHPYYDETSAEGVAFTDWLDALVNAEDFPAQSVKYSN